MILTHIILFNFLTGATEAAATPSTTGLTYVRREGLSGNSTGLSRGEHLAEDQT